MKSDSIKFNGRRYEFDAGDPIDISIPLRFNGPQPNAYGVDPASSEACEAGDLVGDTRLGGSCNFERYSFIPHCSGTHTECVGHIINERISVRDCLKDVFIPAVLASVRPQLAAESGESYSSEFGAGDLVISCEQLAAHVSKFHPVPPDTPKAIDHALIIRTLPNDESKLTRRYDSHCIPPYFTTEAMEYIVECGFKHLLVDLPSIDRLFDEGKLSNHRILWNVEQGSFETHSAARIYSTITELIYVPNDVADGKYLLNLQIGPFNADAAPSRPILFKMG